MYVAVKGGETAIAHSLDLIADKRRGDRGVAELSLEQIDQPLHDVQAQPHATVAAGIHVARLTEHLEDHRERLGRNAAGQTLLRIAAHVGDGQDRNSYLVGGPGHHI